MANRNSNEEFDRLLQQAQTNRGSQPLDVSGGTPLQSDSYLKDNFQVEQRKLRTLHITSILQYYKDNYNDKITFQKRYRKILFWGCSTVIAAFSVSVIAITGFAILHHSDLDLSGVAAVITTALSFIFAIIKLMEVITKYCFPENDDEYILKMIQEIQENDLANVKEANHAAETLHNKSQNTANVRATIHIPKIKKKHREK